MLKKTGGDSFPVAAVGKNVSRMEISLAFYVKPIIFMKMESPVWH